MRIVTPPNFCARLGASLPWLGETLVKSTGVAAADGYPKAHESIGWQGNEAMRRRKIEFV
jgi:hypothetical protein